MLLIPLPPCFPAGIAPRTTFTGTRVGRLARDVQYETPTLRTRNGAPTEQGLEKDPP